jgi:hypothetical protein
MFRKVNTHKANSPESRQTHLAIVSDLQRAISHREQIRPNAESAGATVWLDYMNACKAVFDAEDRLKRFLESLLE